VTRKRGPEKAKLKPGEGREGQARGSHLSCRAQLPMGMSRGRAAGAIGARSPPPSRFNLRLSFRSLCAQPRRLGKRQTL